MLTAHATGGQIVNPAGATRRARRPSCSRSTGSSSGSASTSPSAGSRTSPRPTCTRAARARSRGRSSTSSATRGPARSQKGCVRNVKSRIVKRLKQKPSQHYVDIDSRAAPTARFAGSSRASNCVGRARRFGAPARPHPIPRQGLQSRHGAVQEGQVADRLPRRGAGRPDLRAPGRPSLTEADSFRPHFGGALANVAVAAARTGAPVGARRGRGRRRLGALARRAARARGRRPRATSSCSTASRRRSPSPASTPTASRASRSTATRSRSRCSRSAPRLDAGARRRRGARLQLDHAGDRGRARGHPARARAGARARRAGVLRPQHPPEPLGRRPGRRRRAPRAS